VKNHHPPATDLRIILFKSQATDDKFHLPGDYGWSGSAKSLDIVNVPRKHLTVFALEQITTLAAEIAKRL
jgi:thioesterase domain-containing protein